MGNFFFLYFFSSNDDNNNPVRARSVNGFGGARAERERETKKSGGAFFRNAGGVLLFLGRGNSSRRRHGRVWEQCAFWEHNASCGC